jgi:glycosyltransferase involved in cell wall biosynthesis
MEASRQPKILWLTNLPAPYRFPIWERMAESFDLKVAFLLGEKNWRNWTVPDRKSWKHEHLSLRSKNIKEFDLIPSIRGANRLLRDVDLVVLGGWEAPFYLRILMIAKHRKIPVIQFYESTADSHRFKGKIFNKIRYLVFSFSERIITPGDAAARAVHATGIPLSKLTTLFNPVDLSVFGKSIKPLVCPNSAGHSYIYSGRLISQKNIESLICAFSAMRKHADTLTIVGDGPLAEDLKSLVVTLEIEDWVTFIGHQSQDELAELYSKCNTLILPSTNEVWGLVVNEALASGLHVVVSKNCGVSEFIKDMQGVYICGIDEQSIKDAMVASSLQWNGYITKPEILEFTCEKFADQVTDLVTETIFAASVPDLIWFTNIPTPYRLPTWGILHNRLKLHLLFLAETEYGRNWELEDSLKTFDSTNLKERAIYQLGATPVYFNFIKPIREIGRLNAKSIYIDGWESPAFFVSALYAKHIGMRLIYGYRSTQESHRFKNLIIRKIRSLILSRADLIVTAGPASSKAVEAMGIAPEKIASLFNPVDVTWFHSFARNHQTSIRIGHHYIYVGQLIDRKNVATVLRSFAAIRIEGDTLTIVGDGVLSQKLRELSASLGIAESVIFEGHRNQEDLAVLYAASNTLILVSSNEVWGLVVNEALASGLHVVVSNKCGVAEFVHDMDGAFICGEDLKSVQEAMIRSSRHWTGPIKSPEILSYTPERFTQNFLQLVSDVL